MREQELPVVLLRGIIAGLGNKPKHEDMATRMLATEVQNAGMTPEEEVVFVRAAIQRFFGDDSAAFMQAIRRKSVGDAVKWADHLRLATVKYIGKRLALGQLNQHTQFGVAFESVLLARSELPKSCDGTVNNVIRAFAAKMRTEDILNWIDRLGAVNGALETLSERVLSRFGFHRVLCMVRHCFLGKTPEEAEAEMERLMEINTVHGLLLGSWMHPVRLDDPNMESILMRERMHFARLQEIDPDRAVSFFEGSAPRDRRED